MTTGPRVCVVVPTRDAERTLERCLASVRAQTYRNVELIVVDNHSGDTTRDIARRHADAVVVAGPERSAQRNHGWRMSGGEYVVFIDADMVLTDTVLADVLAAFQAEPGIGALVLPELAFGQGFLAQCRALEKRLYLGDGRVEAARAFPRRVLLDLGGYDEHLTAFEDWELPDRVRAAGYGIGRVASLVLHDEGRVGLRRAFRKKRYYGRWLPRYRQARSAAPRPLGRPALLAHPLLALRAPHHFAGLLLLKAFEWSGLALGASEGRVRP
ncbi:glycosyltransferase family 2 protein [Dactylosporangium vinaceum]|uniref:Glycosyltransferase family 2 protein n=1 Tax=Dactylosporangium vinaceum TaxID=53362 RepID=A0ABV5MKS9_9ACTN|nr:glycosyltransferase family A protein [Dactylosporangium vinaceum]UAB93911.1 glycosyltransferase family 2 protein [Dactylosporangium vinaceum]